MFYPSSYCLWRHDFIIDPDAAKTRLGTGNVLKYFTTFTSFTCQSAAESASLQSSFVAGPPLVFRDPGFGLFGARDSGFQRILGARFGIVFINGTRDLALLQSGIGEIVALKPRDPEFLTAKKFKATQLLLSVTTEKIAMIVQHVHFRAIILSATLVSLKAYISHLTIDLSVK